MTGWNFADVWERTAAARPARPAQIQGGRVVDWAQFDARADALAKALVAAGLSHQSKVAAYLFNAPEYLETYYAAFKAGLAPFNTNFRYGAEEIHYLFDNADAEAVVFHASFAPRLEEIRARLPGVKVWISVGEPDAGTPSWALDYEQIVADRAAGGRFVAPWGRSGEDLLLIYTGGTTGAPKGVMWRQQDLFEVLGRAARPDLGLGPLIDLSEIASRVTRPAAQDSIVLVTPPLMHGAGLCYAMVALDAGDAVALLPSRRFDPEEVFNEVTRLGVSSLSIAGSAFSTPMLEVLARDPVPRCFGSVRALSSSGAMLSRDHKLQLLDHFPNAAIRDALGSSEALGAASSVTVKGDEPATAAFQLGPTCALFTPEGRRLEPGDSESGMLARSGALPMGYYKDPEKTAAVFRVLDGQRWSFTGDWAEFTGDGEVRLLGRGSQCINTGGEKVYPEEVEEALKAHAAVRDAAVLGIPDERFGEAICALVELNPGDGAGPTGGELADFVRGRLARYKAPRHVFFVESVGRAVNGKLDYTTLRQSALDALGTVA